MLKIPPFRGKVIEVYKFFFPPYFRQSNGNIILPCETKMLILICNSHCNLHVLDCIVHFLKYLIYMKKKV